MLTKVEMKMILKAGRRAGYDWSRRGNTKSVDYDINQRAAIRERILAVAVNGEYGIICSGMDCDCTAYRWESVQKVPTNWFAFMRSIYSHEESLDGPESTHYVRPDEVEDGKHIRRDLALEAYEDGHPSVVYYSPL